MSKFIVGEKPLTCDRLIDIARNPGQFALSQERKAAILDARQYVDAVLEGNAPVYGINTGVGS